MTGLITSISGNSRPLKIAIADPDPEMQALYQESLPAIGHQIVCVTGSGKELVDRCCAAVPEVAVMDIDLEEMDGISASIELGKLAPAAVVLVTKRFDEESLRRATGDHVMAYLVKPINPGQLIASIPIARARFEQWKLLHDEFYDASTAIRDRNAIEQAKRILMQRAGIEEPDAYRRMQKMSWDKNIKLAKVAEMIITAEDAFALE